MKFLVVDVDSVFRRQWEALGDGAIGEAARAALGRILGAREGCDRIVLCRDRGRSFRTEIEPEYKANRNDPGEAYREQRRALVSELVRATGATAWVSPVLGRDGGDRELYGEADDVIASFCLWYQERRLAGEEGFDGVRIYTGDTDLWALVDDELGISIRTLEGTDIGTDQVIERFGVAPVLVPELRALAGDSSDNYAPFANPGRNAKGGRLPGIGETWAARIVLHAGAAGDACGTDAVLHAVLRDEPPQDLSLPANVLACLKHGGWPALVRGRGCARLRPQLRFDDASATWEPLDFAKVLLEPLARPAQPEQRAPAPADPEPQAVEPQVASASTALAIPDGSIRARSLERSGLDPYAFEPSDLGQAMGLAHEAFKSKLYPNMPNEAAVLMLMCRARCLGLPAALAGDYFDFATIRGVGRLIWRAQGMLAVVKRDSTCRQLEFDWGRCNDQQAVLLFQRMGERANETTFTLEMARRAGWLDKDGPWKSRPGVMLRWAAVREVCRAVWGDVLGGLYTREELESEAAEIEEPDLT